MHSLEVFCSSKMACQFLLLIPRFFLGHIHTWKTYQWASFLFYCFWYIKAVSQVWLIHRTCSEFCAIMLITNCLQTTYVGFSSKYVVAEMMLSLIFQWTQVCLILEICTSFLVCSCWQYLGWIICLVSNLVLFFIHDEWEGAKWVNFSPKKVSFNPCLSDILIYQSHISSIPWDRWIVLWLWKKSVGEYTWH